ncbi:hypothetical protein BO86DRAFT_180001 [Aspergillus japonicus CBS 114.51]|uniref:Uncharacterized protein n=1 Tax=Aspergillus japonicus CBS 114.51 TaxID=1448312 RepID=A0A8T8WRI6_ASPJA|nr:hypothetical protein BO86DRAFT_180001 [Aspergillus japonicus CBS 114.51]RAH78478.1 hypothetical protein BO86DRAFT_180001 [Aspergillus japonicus CBS 114.51]
MDIPVHLWLDGDRFRFPSPLFENLKPKQRNLVEVFIKVWTLGQEGHLVLEQGEKRYQDNLQRLSSFTQASMSLLDHPELLHSCTSKELTKQAAAKKAEENALRKAAQDAEWKASNIHATAANFQPTAETTKQVFTKDAMEAVYEALFVNIFANSNACNDIAYGATTMMRHRPLEPHEHPTTWLPKDKTDEI